MIYLEKRLWSCVLFACFPPIPLFLLWLSSLGLLPIVMVFCQFVLLATIFLDVAARVCQR